MSTEMDEERSTKHPDSKWSLSTWRNNIGSIIGGCAIGCGCLNRGRGGAGAFYRWFNIIEMIIRRIDINFASISTRCTLPLGASVFCGIQPPLRFVPIHNFGLSFYPQIHKNWFLFTKKNRWWLNKNGRIDASFNVFSFKISYTNAQNLHIDWILD